jgi:predicted metal-dependent HD superfamily phosphohydrolase
LVNHELAGSLKAEAFLKNKDLDEETINAVKNCILATRLPQKPQNLLEQIICDADLFHIGTTDFAKQSKLILREMEAVHNVQIDETDWWNTTTAFLENHQYHTDYCKKVLNNTKRYNLEKLKEKLQESSKASIPQISSKRVCRRKYCLVLETK